MELFPIGRVYDFMGKRRLFAGLSLLLVVASMLVLVRPGPSLGTDFRGGTEIEVAFLGDTQPAEIREAVTQAGFSSPDVVRVEDDANPHRFLIRVQEVSSIDEAQRSSISKALCHGDGAPAAECPAERRAVRPSRTSSWVTGACRSRLRRVDPTAAWPSKTGARIRRVTTRRAG